MFPELWGGAANIDEIIDTQSVANISKQISFYNGKESFSDRSKILSFDQSSYITYNGKNAWKEEIKVVKYLL